MNETTTIPIPQVIFLIQVLSTPTAATLNLFGNWANVYNHAVYINKRPSYPVSINTIGTTVLFDTIAPFNDRVVNAFYHVNRVHDFMKSKLPAFNGMDYALEQCGYNWWVL